ncbi:MAG: hypothetical protein AABZ31_09695 [Bdellovibrionota bacterium]
MSNALKYIKDLEAAGFQRSQAEAQVQMVLDAIEGDLVTKHDFAVFKEHVDNRFAQSEARMDNRFTQVYAQIKESEFRTITRLGILNVSTISIAVAILAWLIKV